MTEWKVLVWAVQRYWLVGIQWARKWKRGKEEGVRETYEDDDVLSGKKSSERVA